MKKNCLNEFFASLDSEKLESIIGLKNPDALRYGFAHANIFTSGSVKMLDKSLWQNTWAGLLSKKKAPGKRVAYIHIPFCQSRCLYCIFFRGFSDKDLEDAYIDRLLKELELSQSPFLEAAPLQSVFFGGGTPSSLSVSNCDRLLKGVRKYLPLANDCEITFESRIYDLNQEKLEVIFSNGVNRISLGVQTFNTKLRQSMGRINTQEEILTSLKEISSYNQAAIIIDLIYGFPTQNQDMFLDDLKLLKNAALDGFDLYHLKLHGASPLQKAIENNSLPNMATLAQKAEMFAMSEEFLTKEQYYSRRSIRHWAKSHRERNLNNTLNKQGASVIPFGSGAGGNINGYRMQLDRDVKSYIQQIDAGKKPIVFMSSPHWLKKLFDNVTGQIESGYLDLPQLVAEFGEEINEIEKLLTIWEKRGLVRKNNGLIVLETAGRFWHMNITQSLLECFQAILPEDSFTKTHRADKKNEEENYGD